jgi:hypothetical protein
MERRKTMHQTSDIIDFIRSWKEVERFNAKLAVAGLSPFDLLRPLTASEEGAVVAAGLYVCPICHHLDDPEAWSKPPRSDERVCTCLSDVAEA